MPESKTPFKIFDAVTLAAERTSDPINLNGAASFTLGFNFTRVAATGLYFEFDFYPNKADCVAQTAAVKFKMDGGSVALDGTNANETLEPYKAIRTISASVVECFSVPALMPFCRVRLNDVATGGATDIVTVWCCTIQE